ncbi:MULTISPECIES: response regulator [unclassified Mesorhizobium]|uniref:response regulator n=1 Tax=unclassified Mesorhizobium TaxID=325217 RepID=UPI00112E5274|nr:MULTISPECIES: response regulator [unclassified Mesorhizobium]TPI51220.1 response regulator [Mesorhizobium sp. B3-1-1]TPJ61360.1 response regulator [Mesorhizobium sp. B2-6-7]TPJ78267.1 response regulator [Mesorhizobium sp. B2-6-3]TPJ92569.1 response regulator [Mesorhizobium sp. B2-5-10]TPK04471.1 response regulator [Mesorhizobium sp. B2-5-11]
MLVLLVEDDALAVERFQEALDLWNEQHTEQLFQMYHAASVESAKQHLGTYRFDGAMVDLRIPRNGPGQVNADGGNSITNFILEERAMPLAIISSNLEELDQTIALRPHIRQFNKGDVGVYAGAVGWLGEQWRMMEVVRSARRTMEQSAAEVFTKRLWPQWSDLSAGADFATITAIISRQYASHLAEYLGLDTPDAVAWHPYETYISPSFYEGRAHTGDIFHIEDEHWVVLTPQCDMSTQKVNTVILAKCEKGIDNWAENISTIHGNSPDIQKLKSNHFLLGYINQNLPASRHFLPPLPRSDIPLLVDFGSLKAMSMQEINGRLAERLLSIAPTFLINLTQRFGAYISRTGQPNLDPLLFQAAV